MQAVGAYRSGAEMATFWNMPESSCRVRCEVASLRAAEGSSEGKGQSGSDSRARGWGRVRDMHVRTTKA